MRTAHVWRWPIVIGVVSAVGLFSALAGDGWADTLSWLLLAVPVACALRGAFGGRGSGRVGATARSAPKPHEPPADRVPTPLPPAR
jgi:hypothetical protein